MRKMLKMKTMLMNVLIMETQMLMKSMMTNHLNRKKKEEEEEVKEGKTKMLKTGCEARSTWLVPKKIGVPEGREATQG